MNPRAFSRVLENCPPGTRIELQFNDGKRQRSTTGTLLECYDDGILLETEGLPQYVSCRMLDRLSILSIALAAQVDALAKRPRSTECLDPSIIPDSDPSQVARTEGHDESPA